MKRKPLTLDELKVRDKKAVFCVDNAGNKAWALVSVTDEICFDADFRDWEFYEYGWDSPDGWLAYEGEI